MDPSFGSWFRVWGHQKLCKNFLAVLELQKESAQISFTLKVHSELDGS